MFRSLRTARLGRAVLLIAGFLAVAGSFGLHPEPERALAAFAAGAQWGVLNVSSDTNTHVCLACLAHRAIWVSRLSSVVLAPLSTAPASISAAPSCLARLEAHPREGRAPPALD